MRQLFLDPPQELLRAIELNEFSEAAEAATVHFPDDSDDEGKDESPSHDSSRRSLQDLLGSRPASPQDEGQFDFDMGFDEPCDHSDDASLLGVEGDQRSDSQERAVTEEDEEELDGTSDAAESSVLDFDTDADDPDRLRLFDEDESDGSDGYGKISEGSSEAGSAMMEDGEEGVAAVADGPTSSRHSQDFFDQLAGSYRPGPRPQHPPDPQTSPLSITERLTASEKETLRHIRTSIKTRATELQYREFAKDKQRIDPDITIYGKDRAISLVKRVTRLKAFKWDMCPESCMAFVGPHRHLQHCTAKRDGRRCGAARYDAKGKPQRQYTTLLILPRVRAKFASGSGSTYLHDQAEWSANTWGTDDHNFGDWSDGAIHRSLREKGLFDNPRHDAFILSTDGAQIVDKRKSNGWIVLLCSLNVLHTKRFKRPETFISTIVPGPNNPIDLDSFLWPILAQFARAARGYWMWDGARREWFLWKAWVVGAAAD